MRAHGRLLVLLGLSVLLIGTAPAVAPPAAAAPLFGHDISWPQCPPNGQPMPPTTTEFVIIGLTRGLPFTENPCLQFHVDWQETNGVPAHGYVVVAFPTAAQLSTYGSQGPWSARTRAGQLSNTGYAAAQFALSSLRRVGFTAPTIWIDVEPRSAQPWPTATPAQQRENRLVVEGTMRAFRDAGFGYGLYSYLAGWQEITGSWWLPGVPVWATAGRLDYPDEARDRCVQPSFSGGRVLVSQWYDDTRDYDLTCGTYAFAPVPVPPSSPSGSTGDFDGTWTDDVLARDPRTGDLFHYGGTGSGTMTPTGSRIGTGWGQFDVLDTPGDLNGDGAADVLARRPNGDLLLYPGDGRGGWLAPSLVGIGWHVMNAIVSPGDFDGDQRADVLARVRATGELWLYPGNGAGSWLPRRLVGVGWNGMDALLSPGDFTGDGFSDVLAREQGSGNLWLYPGNGAGSWLPRRLVGNGWQVMDAVFSPGDFTSDRVGDGLARRAGTGELFLYPGNGSGGWLPTSRPGTGWNVFDVLF